jgi:hypothetical protein
MTIYKKTIKEIFEALHDEENKRFFNNLVLLTHNDENYTCALTDESVRYGTNDYEVFENAVKNDFSLDVANQILTYEIQLFDRDFYFMALDTTIPYFVDDEKKVLHITAYPKEEFEDTKAYKSGKC